MQYGRSNSIDLIVITLSLCANAKQVAQSNDEPENGRQQCKPSQVGHHFKTRIYFG